MSFWRPKVRDGRGRKVAIRPRPDRQAAWSLSGLLIFLLAAAWFLLRSDRIVPAGVAAAMMLVVLLVLARRWRDLQSGRFIWATWLCQGRCPSCEYDIAEIPPQEDGCTVCPECGAAWKMPVPPLAE